MQRTEVIRKAAASIVRDDDDGKEVQNEQSLSAIREQFYGLMYTCIYTYIAMKFNPTIRTT